MTRTRNSRKITRDPEPEYNPKQQQASTPKPQNASTADPSNPFGLSFVTPTELVLLPSRGQYYPVGSPLCEVSEVEIRHMTAKEEDLLSSTTENNNKSVFDRLIDGLLVDTTLNSSMFLENDKVAILLSARNSGYGSEYVAEGTCSHCGAQTDFSFDLSSPTIAEPSDRKVQSTYNSSTDMFTLKLPKTGLQVEIKNIKEEDLQRLEKEKEQKSKHGIEYNHTICFLSTALVSVNSISDREQITKLIQVLPAIDAKTITSFFENCYPALSTLQDVECASCGGLSAREVPFSWALFRADI
jgi:hypothetical protein